MSKAMRWAAGLALLCGAAWAGETFTADQLKAMFSYDLGPAEIDVSSYPKEQQAAYAVFVRGCSQCHTLARPINAPLIARKDWKRFIARMHLRTKVRPQAGITKEEAGTIADFLAYDSRRRKVERKAEFEAKSRELESLFERVKKERARLQIEEDRKKARQAPMGAGEKPAP